MLQCLSAMFKGIPQFPYLFKLQLGSQSWRSDLSPSCVAGISGPQQAVHVLTEVQQHAVRGEGGAKLFLQVVGPVQQGFELLSKPSSL